MTPTLPSPDLSLAEYAQHALATLGTLPPKGAKAFLEALEEANPLAHSLVLIARGAPADTTVELFRNLRSVPRGHELLLDFWRQSGRSIAELFSGPTTLWPIDLPANDPDTVNFSDSDKKEWLDELARDLPRFLKALEDLPRAAKIDAWFTHVTLLRTAIMAQPATVVQSIVDTMLDTLTSTSPNHRPHIAHHIIDGVDRLCKEFDLKISDTHATAAVNIILELPNVNDTRIRMATRFISLAPDPTALADQLTNSISYKEVLFPYFSHSRLGPIVKKPSSLTIRQLKALADNPVIQSDLALAQELVSRRPDFTLITHLWVKAKPSVQQYLIDHPQYWPCIQEYLLAADRSIKIPPSLFAKALATLPPAARAPLISRLKQTHTQSSPTP